MYRRLIEEQFIVHKTSHSRVTVFCQILTHNGYEFVHGSRWLKMELNWVVKKHNHTAGSPRCSFCLYSNLAMMTKGYAQCISRAYLLLCQVLQPVLSSLLLRRRLRWLNSFRILHDAMSVLTYEIYFLKNKTQTFLTVACCEIFTTVFKLSYKYTRFRLRIHILYICIYFTHTKTYIYFTYI